MGILRDVSGIQEGDKYISRGPVGGRYYKEYKLEYKNNVQDYEDFENFKNKGYSLKEEITSNFDTKYFRKGDEYCVIHVDVEKGDKNEIYIKAHCILEPE